MRYLDELGIYSELILYSNEGIPSLSNEVNNPQSDTYCFEEYSHRVHRIKLRHGILPIFNIRSQLSWKNYREVIDRYDICIGSGITPSLFRKAGKTLDIFYPVATGVDWLDDPLHLDKINNAGLLYPLRLFIYMYQLESIKQVSANICSQKCDRAVFESHNIDYKFYLYPQYYPHVFATKAKGTLLKFDLNKELVENGVPIFNNDYLKIFSFMRQFWVRPSGLSSDQWLTISKRNDVLIYGFSMFAKTQQGANSRLFLIDWGDDVLVSKKLIRDLCIEDKVVWIPLLPRKLITLILQYYADVAIGQLTASDGTLWGSTTWECLASGIPLIQSMPSNIYLDYGLADDLITFDCHKASDIYKSLSCISNNLVEAKKSSHLNSYWFKQLMLNHVVPQIRDLILDLYEQKALFRDLI